jgi:hypothetical protein
MKVAILPEGKQPSTLDAGELPMPLGPSVQIIGGVGQFEPPTCFIF